MQSIFIRLFIRPFLSPRWSALSSARFPVCIYLEDSGASHDNTTLCRYEWGRQRHNSHKLEARDKKNCCVTQKYDDGLMPCII